MISSIQMTSTRRCMSTAGHRITAFAAPAAITALALLGGCAQNNVPAPVDAAVADAPYVRPLCTEYSFRDAVYDCEQLDRCNSEDLTYRVACCECDPIYCNPDPTCAPPPEPVGPAESCMGCHNGSALNDYAGPGMSNPHPFPGAPNVECTTCHGGDGTGVGKLGSHVPPPPEIGNRENLARDPQAYFNRLTLSGLDKLPDYTVDGKVYSALDYLQFVNPGDLRVVTDGRGCGTPACHADQHAEWVPRTVLGSNSGFFSSAMYAVGSPNHIPEHEGLYEDTAAEYGFRDIEDPDWSYDPARVGTVGRLDEWPERAQFGDITGIYDNDLYDAADMANQVDGQNRIIPGSPLEHVFQEAVAITCGDCHLGSAGANNRYADFRSSGCTSCHMEYSRDGRSRSTDPNVNHYEPADPDAIAAPERSHIDSHQIRNVAKFLPNGAFQRGISDYACVGCHQGSNRTVLQYWGIRLDQNQDLENGTQYPANPETFENTANDRRLFDPAVDNETFNGRVPEQYILEEDYDGDGRDDTPPDVHHEAGLGCIDCHGSRDLHNGTPGDPTSGAIISRMDQAVQIQCQSCHGEVNAYLETAPCRTYSGETAECGLDRLGNPLRHVTRGEDGSVWLVSRLTGARHFVPQVRDTVVDNGQRNPLTDEPVFNALASYAMGRADGNPDTGIGPQQANGIVRTGFSHTDRVDCVTCHAAWTNNCVGCHLKNQYDDNPDNFFFSNITGERIVNFQANADFTYQTPVPFYLGVNSRGRVAAMAPGTQMFYRYEDLNGVESRVFVFSDRNGDGNNPGVGGRDPFPSNGHDSLMPHSIRGRVSNQYEGPRYCVSCHLTQEGINRYGDQYQAFRTAMANNDFGSLNFGLLRQHIGQNTGNQLNSPIWVHMVAGLGSGLFLFDVTGCPENPLDNNANRQYCPDGAPAETFNPGEVVYNLDGIVEPTGVQNSSSAHPMQSTGRGQELRNGASNPNVTGPLGADIIRRLTDPATGIVLDSWLTADGALGGNASAYVAR